MKEGLVDGIEVVGSWVGLGDGTVEGIALGAALGIVEGLDVGIGVVGKFVGCCVGNSVGRHVSQDNCTQLSCPSVLAYGKISQREVSVGGIFKKSPESSS